MEVEEFTHLSWVQLSPIVSSFKCSLLVVNAYYTLVVDKYHWQGLFLPAAVQLACNTGIKDLLVVMWIRMAWKSQVT